MKTSGDESIVDLMEDIRRMSIDIKKEYDGIYCPECGQEWDTTNNRCMANCQETINKRMIDHD